MEKRIQSGFSRNASPAAPVQRERQYDRHAAAPLSLEEARRQLGWGMIVAERKRA